MLIPGNILHVGYNLIDYKTPQDKPSVEIKDNLLITTNETSYDCKFGAFLDDHCEIKSLYVIWLPSSIRGISHFHQINTSHIVVIPPDQYCLHIFERIIDKLTTKDIIGNCYSRGHRDGSNPLFYGPSQSLSDNGNREILYVIDKNREEIRMVNIADRMAGTLKLQLGFGAKYSQITQAENSTFYIAVESSSSTFIMSLDLIPPKNASSKYFLTLNRLNFDTKHVYFFFSNNSKVRQMTWISNHTLMIMDERPWFYDNEVSKLPKFLNFSAETHGYININSSFAIDRNLSRYDLVFPILYAWVNDSMYITSPATTYRLTRQQLEFAISKDDHHTGLGFYWQTRKYLLRERGAERKREK